jgi:hypothetical protein
MLAWRAFHSGVSALLSSHAPHASNSEMSGATVGVGVGIGAGVGSCAVSQSVALALPPTVVYDYIDVTRQAMDHVFWDLTRLFDAVGG